MPGIVMDRNTGSTIGTTPHGRWIDQQQYLVETYRQIRTNLGQLEAEIEAARLRVTDWTRLRRHPSRSRSLSHASVSTTASSLLSCSTFESGTTDASFLNVTTDGTTGSSCHSSCSSTCGIQLPSEIAAKLSAATLISAFLAASHDFTQDKIQDSTIIDHLEKPIRARTPDQFISSNRSRSNRSISPSSQ
ncbi:unnamed protein product [Schistosoma rodhaini]|uniref:Uncharacterized protein n=1 Tax=Schistosoma rodhaini TaxID=6188 RepID=A0A183QLS0_9TREM|nr:unnamed protein product [Schistosoma rodhaini]